MPEAIEPSNLRPADGLAMAGGVCPDRLRRHAFDAMALAKAEFPAAELLTLTEPRGRLRAECMFYLTVDLTESCGLRAVKEFARKWAEMTPPDVRNLIRVEILGPGDRLDRVRHRIDDAA